MVIFSGGQDSTTCLYWAKRSFDEVVAISFDYGQRHDAELTAAAKISTRAGVAHEFVKVGPILSSSSPLVSNSELETYEDYASMDTIIGTRIEKTFVPMRNAFFLTLAANHAVAQGCHNLVTGVCQSDNANYPDCRQEFISAQEQTINAALGIDDFIIWTPLINLDKRGIVDLAWKLGSEAWDALKHSHTCYAGERPPCGKCHSCVLRAHGFEQAGKKDPLIQYFE